jgi:hypothetical protein
MSKFEPRGRHVSTSRDVDAPPATAHHRLRALLDGGALPQPRSGPIWAGRCGVRHECIVCCGSIDVGVVEFEVTSPAGVVLFLDQKCFDLWAREPAAE